LSVCKEAEGKITSILCFIEFFAVPILYVPGNHDPLTLFEPNKEEEKQDTKHKFLTQFSHNLHLQSY